MLDKSTANIVMTTNESDSKHFMEASSEEDIDIDDI